MAFVLSVFSFGAYADIAGDQNQRYQDLEREWLSGKDDLKTLQMLVALAQSDNTAAQLFLGMIQRETQTYNHVHKAQPTEWYGATFRKPNDRFGEPWLKIAARSNELAALLYEFEVDDYEAHSAALADAGAIKRAIDAANLLANQNDHQGAIRALSHPKLLPYTKVTLHWYTQAHETGLRISGDTQLADEFMMLRISLPPLEFKDSLLASHGIYFVRDDELREARNTMRLRGAAILHHPDLMPLVEIVQDVCPVDTAYHMGVVFYLKGGNFLRMRMLSPYGPIISTKKWQQSGRFRGDILRNWHTDMSRFGILQELSPCFANAAIAEM
jgi:hypothetical protein